MLNAANVSTDQTVVPMGWRANVLYWVCSLTFFLRPTKGKAQMIREHSFLFKTPKIEGTKADFWPTIIVNFSRSEICACLTFSTSCMIRYISLKIFRSQISCAKILPRMHQSKHFPPILKNALFHFKLRKCWTSSLESVPFLSSLPFLFLSLVS